MARKECEREGRTYFVADAPDQSLFFKCQDVNLHGFQKAIFIVNKIAESVWMAIGGEESYLKFGTVEIKSNGRVQVVTELYYREGDSCVIVRNVGSVPQSLLSEWTHHVLLSDIREIIVFEGMYLSKYNRSVDSRIRILCSSAVDATKNASHSAMQLRQLEVGNILDGCAAAIFCRAELNSLSAVIYVVVRDASYTIEAARSLELLGKELSSFLGGRDILFPDLNFHRHMLRSDGFLHCTESMFT